MVDQQMKDGADERNYIDTAASKRFLKASTMPLTALLKQLRFQMISLQSPRSQCCCCTVGVLAALFGIFTLSAGICIVLNVTFMEVDTSGLPPGLHNDEGKKVVGVLLICLAIVCLGLSGTVSALYFAFCNRKGDATTSSVVKSNKQGQANEIHVPGATGSSRTGKSRKNGLKHSRQSSFVTPVTAGQYRKNKRRKKAIGHLPPHEEEAEAGKSQTDIQNSSTKPFSSEIQKVVGNDGEGTDLSISTACMELSSQSFTFRDELNSSGVSARNIDLNYMKRASYPDSDIKRTSCLSGDILQNVYMNDDISSAYSEVDAGTASARWLSPHESMSSSFTIEVNEKSYQLDTFRQNSFDDSDLLPPVELPHNIEVANSLYSSDPVSHSYSLHNNRHLQLLNVRPLTPSSSSNTHDVLVEGDNSALDQHPPFNHQSENKSFKDNGHASQARNVSGHSVNSAIAVEDDNQDQNDTKTYLTKIQLRDNGCSESNL